MASTASIFAQTGSSTVGEIDAEADSELTAEALAEIKLNCGGDKECLKNELTRIRVKDRHDTDVMIEMPASKK